MPLGLDRRKEFCYAIAGLLSDCEDVMQLPFTVDAFYGVFREYNEALWPAQLLLTALAIAAIVFIFKPQRRSGVAISAILAFLWAWLALAYHLAFFVRINPMAYAFSAISMMGALAFLWQGVIRRRLQFEWVGGVRAFTGIALIVFALVIYPAWSWYAGHHYPAMPTFGLPCPTTIFTIGMLAFLAAPYPRSVYAVPILWSFVGGQAAFLLGVPQDLGLIIAGLVGAVLMARSRSSAAPATTAVS